MNIIKRCPHCGGEAQLYSSYSYKMDTFFLYIKCEICGAQGKSVRTKDDPKEVNIWETRACQNALAAWNMRVGEDYEESQDRL